MREGELLKQVVGKQAIVYKVTGVQTTAVQVEELCIVGAGKMTITYRQRIGSHVYQSDIGTKYKVLKCEEQNTILEILKNIMVEVGY